MNRMKSSQRDRKLSWTVVDIEGWSLLMAATEDGLVYVDRGEESYEEFARWAAKHYPERPVIRDEADMQPYVQQLIEYWRGERRTFSLPVVFHGTAFQRSVWEALRGIAYGETLAYGDIAEQIGRSKAVRAVGAAVGANPLMIVVPCHRVVGKDGSLTGFSGGLDMKKRLLEIEGWSAKDGYIQYA